MLVPSCERRVDACEEKEDVQVVDEVQDEVVVACDFLFLLFFLFLFFFSFSWAILGVGLLLGLGLLRVDCRRFASRNFWTT